MKVATTSASMPIAYSLRLLHSFGEAEQAWRALEAHGHCSAFQSFDWLSEWQECVGRPLRVRPLLVLIEDSNGAPWMLLPLGLEHRRLARVLIWLGGEFSDYLGPIVGASCPAALLGSGFAALWRHAMSEVPAFAYAHLQRMLPRLGGRANPFMVLGARAHTSASHQTELGTDWDTYYRSTCSTRNRKKHRRRSRRLLEQGDVEFIVPEEPELVDEVVSALLAQKSRFFAELGVPDPFALPARREFVRRMAHRRPRLIHLSCLRIDGRIWAVNWALLHRKRCQGILSSYEQGALTRHSPGGLPLRKVLEWCCQNDVRIYDFGVGDEPYKKRWAESDTPLYDCLIPNSSWGYVCTAGLRARLHAKGRIKASRVLWPLARRVRAQFLGRRVPSNGEATPIRWREQGDVS